MVRHRRSARAEDGEIGAAFLDQPQLVLLDRLADLVIADFGIGGRRLAFLEGGLLRLAPRIVRSRRGGVMSVAIDNQRHAALFLFVSLVALRAALRGRPTAASVICVSTPSACSVAATSSISAARRRPWVSIRSRLYSAFSAQFQSRSEASSEAMTSS